MTGHLTSARPDWRTQNTLTVEEAAEVLGIGRSAAYAAARAGELPTLRIGRRVVVPVGRLRQLLGEDDGHAKSGSGLMGGTSSFLP